MGEGVPDLPGGRCILRSGAIETARLDHRGASGYERGGEQPGAIVPGIQRRSGNIGDPFGDLSNGSESEARIVCPFTHKLATVLNHKLATYLQKCTETSRILRHRHYNLEE